MMQNVDYNLFSILILTILIIYNYFITSKNRISIQLFQKMILLDLVMCLSESMSAMLKSINYFNLFSEYILKLIFFMCFILLPYYFLLYAIYNIYDKKRYDDYRKYLSIPVVLMMVLVLTNPYMQFIFKITTQNSYELQSGWLLIVLYATIYALIIAGLILVNWNKITVSLKLSAMMYVFLSCVSYAILLFVNNDLMISGATVVLSLIIMQLNLQNSQMILEAIVQEQEEKQEAIRANREKSNFLANMSHEVRTPLNVITSMNEMILRESKNEQIEDYAQRIKTADEILTSIINNVFDISKVEVGQVDVLSDEYELAELLKELTAIGHVRAEKSIYYF